MASKGQKFQKISNETRKLVLEEYIKNGKGQSQISKEQGLKLGTVLTIIHKYNQKGYVEKDKQGRIKETNIDYKERYEILKKFQTFLKEQQEKR
jgi:transposase